MAPWGWTLEPQFSTFSPNANVSTPRSLTALPAPIIIASTQYDLSQQWRYGWLGVNSLSRSPTFWHLNFAEKNQIARAPPGQYLSQAPRRGKITSEGKVNYQSIYSRRLRVLPGDFDGALSHVSRLRTMLWRETPWLGFWMEEAQQSKRNSLFMLGTKYIHRSVGKMAFLLKMKVLCFNANPFFIFRVIPIRIAIQSSSELL